MTSIEYRLYTIETQILIITNLFLANLPLNPSPSPTRMHLLRQPLNYFHSIFVLEKLDCVFTQTPMNVESRKFQTPQWEWNMWLCLTQICPNLHESMTMQLPIHIHSLMMLKYTHNYRAIQDSCDIEVRKTGPDQNQKLKPFHLQLIAESNIVHL